MTVDSFIKNYNEGNIKNVNIIDCLIIEEAALLSLPKYCALLNIFSFVKKLILIGDKEQMLSIEYGNVFNDIHKAFSENEKMINNVYNFISNNRFKDCSSIINNMNLIYDNSLEIVDKFIYNDNNTKAINYKDIDELKKSIQIIVENTEEKEFLFYCHKEETCDKLNKLLYEMNCLQLYKGKENDLKLFNLHENLVYKKSVFKIGDVIRNTKNHIEFKLKNCFIFEEEDYINLNEKFYYCIKMVEKMANKHIKLKSYFNEYISNGFRDTIKSIKYGICFNVEEDLNEEHYFYINITKNLYYCIKRKYTLKELIDKYEFFSIKIYETFKQNIIIGNNCIYEDNLKYGYCCTLASVQGNECKNCIFIIPNNIKIFYDFYDSRSLLVGCTRSTHKQFFLYQKIEYKKSEFDEWCLKKKVNFELKDEKYLQFTMAIQIMSINKLNERHSLLNNFIIKAIN